MSGRTNPPGIDVAGVTSWMKDRADVHGDLSFELVVGGRSNLTFIVEDTSATKWVIRRPPTGHVLPKAHDMAREHRILAALQASEVPVPPVVGLCTDVDVTGAPFYVMGFVEGEIMRSQESVAHLSLDQRRQLSSSLVTTLANLHTIDPDDVGLGDLGKREDYLGRQLRRWISQVEQGTERDLPLFREVHDDLATQMPPQLATGIVHGDYRLDNCMIGSDNNVAAVLDWELCTLGDTMADIGLLILYWGDRDLDQQVLENPPTIAEGFFSLDEVAHWYSSATGRDVSALPYYLAFAQWRLACILEGVYTRFKNNAMGEQQGVDASYFGHQVVFLLEQARLAVRAL